MTRASLWLAPLLVSPALLIGTLAGAAPKGDCADADSYDEWLRCVDPTWLGGGDQTCDEPGRVIAPCDTEEKHWIARPFTADRDVEVVAVRYSLFGGKPGGGWYATCDTALAHNVQLLIGTDSLNPGAPESTPVVAASWSVSALEDPGVIGTRTIKLSLDEPVLLEEGEYAFLSVQYSGDVEDGSSCGPESGRSICMAACEEDAPSFWSFADSPAYSWTDLRDVFVYEYPDMGILVRAPGVFYDTEDSKKE